jgi:hypothetical protein
MPELSDVQFAAIGKVADAWATLEFIINKAIWELMNVEQKTGACVTAQIISIQPRLNALISLVTLNGGKQSLINDLNKFAEKAGNLSRQRNRIVHDPWFVQGNTTKTHQFVSTADKKLDFGFKHVPTDNLLALQAKIHSLYHDFNKLHTKILSELPLLDRTRFSKSEGFRPHKNPI